MFRHFLASFSLLPVLIMPLAAQDAALTRDLSAHQSTAASAGVAHPGTLRVAAQIDRADMTYQVGDNVQLTVATNEDAYITVVNIGPTGNVTQLFPNAFQTDNRVRANQAVQIPAPGAAARIQVSLPIGAELIKVIATSRPVTVFAETQLSGNGPFRGVQGGVATLSRNLEVVGAVPAPPADDRKIAISNIVFRTVVQRAQSAAPAQPNIVVVPAAPQQTITATLPVVTTQPAAAPPPVQQAFPLLLALDKPSYKIGENVTMAVTSLQACNLTILEFAPSGAIRVLFPNQLNQNNAIAALSTVLVSGGPSQVTIQAVGPAGAGRVAAICSTDPAPVVSQRMEYTQLFPAITDTATLNRDLSLVPSRPAGTTSVAVAAVAVTP